MLLSQGSQFNKNNTKSKRKVSLVPLLFMHCAGNPKESYKLGDKTDDKEPKIACKLGLCYQNSP